MKCLQFFLQKLIVRARIYAMASCYKFVNFPIFCVVDSFIIHIYIGRGDINIFKSFLGCIDGVGISRFLRLSGKKRLAKLLISFFHARFISNFFFSPSFFRRKWPKTDKKNIVFRQKKSMALS